MVFSKEVLFNIKQTFSKQIYKHRVSKLDKKNVNYLQEQMNLSTTCKLSKMCDNFLFDPVKQHIYILIFVTFY